MTSKIKSQKHILMAAKKTEKIKNELNINNDAVERMTICLVEKDEESFNRQIFVELGVIEELEAIESHISNLSKALSSSLKQITRLSHVQRLSLCNGIPSKNIAKSWALVAILLKRMGEACATLPVHRRLLGLSALCQCEDSFILTNNKCMTPSSLRAIASMERSRTEERLCLAERLGDAMASWARIAIGKGVSQSAQSFRQPEIEARRFEQMMSRHDEAEIEMQDVAHNVQILLRRARALKKTFNETHIQSMISQWIAASDYFKSASSRELTAMGWAVVLVAASEEAEFIDMMNDGLGSIRCARQLDRILNPALIASLKKLGVRHQTEIHAAA